MKPLFVPALPTLWPTMLVGTKPPGPYLPFSAQRARYFYFARNAIWHLVKQLGLVDQEVLVPAYHHGVEIEALVDAGARVQFYRVGGKWDVDLDDVKRRITPKTKALYLIHYAGFPGPVDEMKALAVANGIPLIEDCALSLLSAHGDAPLGSSGDFGIFCLYKMLPVPNGGALVINGDTSIDVAEPPPPPVTSTFSHTVSSLLQNAELRGGAPGKWLRERVRAAGRTTVQKAKIERVTTGSLHFDTAHRDLGMSPLTRRIAQSQDLRSIVETRRRNYLLLMAHLRDVSEPMFDRLAAGTCPLFYPMKVRDKRPHMERLAACGIETIDFWRYFHPACNAADFPEVARLRDNVLEIPCHQDLTPNVIFEIATAVRESLRAENEPRVVA